MEDKAKVLIPENVIGIKTEKTEKVLTERDAILYSLGLGISEDPYKESDLDFTYEFSENFKIFPTLLATFPLRDATQLLLDNPNVPFFNPMSLLHGEMNFTIHKSPTINEKYYYQTVLVDYEDKGSGTIFMFQSEITNSKNEKLFTINSTNFVRDIKGHKYKSNGPISKLSIVKAVPNTTPDFKTKYTTIKNQALIYRIGGNDINPLHVDINLAEMGGFEKPILHGMCFYGIACRGIYDLICERDIENIVSFNARFTSHVFPGETLEVSIWKQKGNKLIVSLETSERKKQVLIGEALIKKPKF